MQLYSRLATEFSIEPLGGSDLYLRSLVDTSYILFFLREFYSLEEEVEEENVAMHECVRPYLLLIIKEYLTKVCVLYVWWALSRVVCCCRAEASTERT